MQLVANRGMYASEGLAEDMEVTEGEPLGLALSPVIECTPFVVFPEREPDGVALWQELCQAANTESIVPRPCSPSMWESVALSCWMRGLRAVTWRDGFIRAPLISLFALCNQSHAQGTSKSSPVGVTRGVV